MIDLGIVKPGTTLYVPFQTFDSNDPSASVTITGLATTDIEIYKDGSVTQRASDAGYSLLDTDGIDFDLTTGIHGVSIDLADNTTAGFYEAGSQYWVVIASITVDAATINFIPCKFTIGYPDAILNTTIATLSTQTSFTLEEGPADNDALNGCPVLVHDVASAVQIAIGFCSDYVGATKTVTLAADPGIFTMAAGDNVSFFLPANVNAWNNTPLTTNDPISDVESSLVIVKSDTTAIHSDTTIIASDVVIVVSDTTAIHSDTTIIASDVVVLDAAVSDVESSLVIVKSDLVVITSDTTAVESELIVVHSETTVIQSDTTAIHSDTTIIASDVVVLDAAVSDVESSLVIVKSDLVIVTSDTAVIESQTTVIESDTAVIEAGVNVTQISGSAAAADNLEAVATGVVTGAAVGTPTTTVIDTDLTEATDDHYNGRILTFTSGNLTGQSTDITDYNGTTKEVTVTALTEAPAATDAFVIT